MDISTLLDKIEKAYYNERNAAALISQLLALAPDYLSTEALVEARRDKREHALKIGKLFKELSGQDLAELQASVPKYTSFRDGLRKVVQAAKEALDFNQEIIKLATIIQVDDLFKKIGEDEITHYIKFQALMRFMHY